ncbi:MAG: hypothetical protein H0V62_00015 [Gammaproteobacteria bacterium]|nr:hypothetical protein [Gammaproteobacteria bacterium]
MRLPTQNGKIKIEYGIKDIAEIVYPDDKDSQRTAIKSVRERVRYACKKGTLHRLDSESAIDFVQFCCWAREQKGWQALKNEPIPRTNRVSVSMDAVLKFADPEIPDDLCCDELRELLIQEKKENRLLRGDRAELEEMRRKEAERKAIGSRYGKEGGRGNTK